MVKMDKRFDGTIFKTKDMSIVPPDQYIVFLVKDNAVPAMLEAYYRELFRIGASDEQKSAIASLRQRVADWRKANPELCKIPDVADGELLDEEQFKEC